MKQITLLAGVVVAALLTSCDSQDATTMTTPTATPEVTAVPPKPTPTGVAGGVRQSGIAEVDVILGAIAVRNVDALMARLALQEMDCVDPNTQGAGGPIRCGAGETVGTKVKAFPSSTCEGDWTRESDLRAMLVQWLDGADLSRGVYGVVRGPSNPRSEPYWPVGEYWAVYSAKPTAALGMTDQATVVVIEDGKVVALRFGCTLTPADEMTYQGVALPVVLPALPEPLR